MPVKHTIHTTVLASALFGLASTSAFSVGPPPTTAVTSPTRIANANAFDLPQFSTTTMASTATATAPLQSTRRKMGIRFATTDGAETSSSSSSKPKNIDLLDEVDSIFDCVDKNGDGEITQEELKSHLVDEMGYSKEYTDYLFESIDTDSNGSISREELRFAFYNFEALSMYMTFGMGGADMTQRASFKKLALQSSGQSYFDQEDVDTDKLLLDDLADLIFEMIDTDQSGEITRQELQDHFDKVTEKLSKNSKDKATSEQAQEYVQTMFETLDANQDGMICRQEIRDAFEKYDFKLLARVFGLKVYQSA